jgi:ABC-2 type transport system permease protein
MNKIRTIIDKEWAEVFKNRMVLFSVLFMPLVFTAIALGVVLATGGAEVDPSAIAELPNRAAESLCEGLSGGDCFTFYLASQFMILFMMVPLIIPVTIAAYSIVGEKTTRSLEPLLATPVSTLELLAGKALAAIIPAVAATWLAFGVYLIGARLQLSREVFGALTGPLWLLAILVVGPLLALLSVTFALMVSSRVTDPRAAEQLAAVVVVPILALFFGQVAGFVVLDQQFVLVFIAVLAVLDLSLLYLAVRVFQRETILTKWK